MNIVKTIVMGLIALMCLPILIILRAIKFVCMRR